MKRLCLQNNFNGNALVAASILVVALVLSLALGSLSAKPAYGETLDDDTEVYTVTFGDTGITRKVKEGEPLGPLPQMAKTKKIGDNPVAATFAGWMEDEGADYKLLSQSDAKRYSEWFCTSSDEIDYDVKLTAVYTLPEYRVHFAWNWPNQGRSTHTTATVMAGSKLSDIDYFTRNEGDKKRHIFTGVWKDNSTNKKVSGSTRVTGELWLSTYLDSKYISEAAVSVPAKTYTGKALKPKPKVKMGNKTLKLGRDYTVKYSNNVKTGAAKIKITGKGKYKGSKTVEFSIVPKTTSITKVTSLKKGFKVTWKKQSNQANGYIVSYKYAGEKYWRLGKEIHGANKTSCTISKLKGGKKYSVRVMPVKWVKQKISPNSNKKYWFWHGNNWSKAKRVKTKK